MDGRGRRDRSSAAARGRGRDRQDAAPRRYLRAASTGVGNRLDASAFRRGTEIVGGVLLELAADLRRSTPGRRRRPPARADLRRRGRRGQRPPAPGARDRPRRHPESSSSTRAGRRFSRLEDLHWADELSLDVLERLAVSLGQTRTLVLATYRTEELFPGTPLRQWRDRLVGQRLAEEAHVRRLDRAMTARTRRSDHRHRALRRSTWTSSTRAATGYRCTWRS